MSAHSRSKRQAMLMYPYHPAYYYPQQTPAEILPQAQAQGTCVTRNGGTGTCLPVSTCYQNIQFNNQAILELILRVSTPCGDPANNQIFNQRYYYYGKKYLQFSLLNTYVRSTQTTALLFLNRSFGFPSPNTVSNLLSNSRPTCC
jgi:hypothetical protein